MTKQFEIDGVTVEFWHEGNNLFCRVPGAYDDVYCCGCKKMPETNEDVLKLTETAWVW